MFFSLLRAGLPMLIVFILEIFFFEPLGFYRFFPDINIFMHLTGGFVTAWSAYRFLKLQKKIPSGLSLWVWYFIFIGAAAIFGILWEVYEFILDPFVAMVMQPSLADTMGDLINDLIGGILFCALIFWRKRKNN